MYQDKPTGGAVFIDGINTTLLNENELVEIRKAKIGFIFQQFNLIHTLDVLLRVHLPIIQGSSSVMNQPAMWI